MALFSKKTYEYLIVGLGNPGRKYEATRHNSGFDALDFVAEKINARVTRARFDALTGDAVIGSHRVLLMKPTTFMNLSGVAVEKAARFYKLEPERVLVLVDDIALDVGTLRVRAQGSAGGHNGLQNIIDRLGSQNFPRIRIGAGKKPERFDQVDWVLGRYTENERKLIRGRYEDIFAAITLILDERVQEAQSRVN